MTEIELRFQIPDAQWAAVRHWVSGEGDATAAPATGERLRASYFDTPSRDLARAGFALRLRLEGDTWVQTLKGAAPDGMTRLEHNVPVDVPVTGEPPTAGGTPALDIARHADHPAGQALVALLEQLGGPVLQALFRTDIQRLSRALTTPFGEVELALDQGALLAGDGPEERRTPVAELEIELKRGEPRAVLEVARDWALRRFGLTLELRTKALRGDLLARGEATAPSRSSQPAPWRPGQTRGQALDTLLKSSVEPVLGNASQIISGVYLPEHLHQLRVALRRLRVGVDLLIGDARAGLVRQDAPGSEDGHHGPHDGPHDHEDDHALRSLGEGARQLCHLLAAARDADAQAQAGWRADLDAAWRRTAIALPVLEEAGRRQAAAGGATQERANTPSLAPANDPVRLLSDPLWQDWMLSIVAWLVRGWPEQTPVEGVATGLEGLARQALHLARRFDKLDVEGRHHLRRRLRRWKLALECCTGLALSAGGMDGTDGAAGTVLRKRRGKDTARGLAKMGHRSINKQLTRVQAVQKPLGELNDLEVALAHARESLVQAGTQGDAYGAARAGFALGWLTPVRNASLVRVARRVKRLKK